jgi:AcrR family transcriptional regulator
MTDESVNTKAADSTARRGRSRDAAQVEQRKRDILAAAARVFAACGYPDTDVQEVAAACGVAKGTVYLYFPSKESLFLAAVDRAMVAMREAVRAAADPVTDPLDRLAVAIRAYFAHFRDHPDHAELLILERAEYRDRKTPTYLEHRRANAAEWEAVYAGLIGAGRIRDVPVDRIMRVTSDLVYGTMFTNHFSGGHRTPDEQAEDVIDILFHGLLTPAERRRRARR